MGPDLRLPIGFMFVLVAAILVIYGWREPAVHAPRTDFNINLYWGIVLLIFGVVMLVLGALAEARKKPEKK